MRDTLSICQALADSGRLRILCALAECAGEMCVCQLTELLQLAPSTVSKHLSMLDQARLVVGRRDGRWMHYRLPAPREASAAVRSALRWVRASLAADPEIQKDAQRVAAILSIEPEELCRRQAKRSACCAAAPGARAAARRVNVGHAG
ncbi:MAG: metalloregulator ArsR/SmtB family transcription factor [Candidatus Sumerlaeota bacterium]|nr:metalloregulator ArsR/SmtB family transcription factor [Candidatus Sumerlaeota bacterium]